MKQLTAEKGSVGCLVASIGGPSYLQVNPVEKEIRSLFMDEIHLPVTNEIHSEQRLQAPSGVFVS